MAFSTFGEKNLYEVSSLTGNSLSYYTKNQLEYMLGNTYEIIHSEEELLPFMFDSPMCVLYHLKRTGVTALKREPGGKGYVMDICERYQHFFSDGKKVHLTYHPIYFIVKKK